MLTTLLIFTALLAADSEEFNKPSFQAMVGRKDSRIRFDTEGETSVWDIFSEIGIDKATIKRLVDKWPEKILLRLHLNGLESFKVVHENVAVEWSVSSAGENEVRTSLISGKRVAEIPKDSPYFSKVRIVGKEKISPLQDGFFEIPLPAKILEGNPGEITLEWIDFYRR